MTKNATPLRYTFRANRSSVLEVTRLYILLFFNKKSMTFFFVVRILDKRFGPQNHRTRHTHRNKNKNHLIMSSSLALSSGQLCLGQQHGGRGARGKVSAMNTAKRWPVSEAKRGRVWSSKSASSSRPSSSSKSCVHAFSEETEETEEEKSAATLPGEEGGVRRGSAR